MFFLILIIPVVIVGKKTLKPYILEKKCDALTTGIVIWNQEIEMYTSDQDSNRVRSYRSQRYYIYRSHIEYEVSGKRYEVYHDATGIGEHDFEEGEEVLVRYSSRKPEIAITDYAIQNKGGTGEEMGILIIVVYLVLIFLLFFLVKT